MNHTITQGHRRIVVPMGFGGWLDTFNKYFNDIWDSFTTDSDTLDFTTPGQFNVKGYDQPLWLPSFIEPNNAVSQYADWANLKPGDTVIDLGAFAGMTAMTFAEAVGPTGTVIALEPDPTNYDCARKNLDTFKAATELTVDLLPLAVWDHTGAIAFVSEHSMGSSSATYIPGSRGITHDVNTVTLSELAKRQNLRRVDYIKMDIEGAEMQAIDDAAFFSKYRPRISVECHDVFGPSTAIVTDALTRYGYDYEIATQDMFPLPLVHGWPR